MKNNWKKYILDPQHSHENSADSAAQEIELEKFPKHSPQLFPVWMKTLQPESERDTGASLPSNESMVKEKWKKKALSL